MLSSKKLVARALAATALGGGLLLAGPASAIITCNSNGDCWRTETRITYPNVTFTYHDDPWRRTRPSAPMSFTIRMPIMTGITAIG